MIRNAVLIVLASASIAAAPPMSRAPEQAPGAVVRPEGQARSQSAAEQVRCLARVEAARAAAGQPMLDRTPADGETGYLIAAVDKRIDGCAVMQMHGDVNDLRPLPNPPTQAPGLRPIE